MLQLSDNAKVAYAKYVGPDGKFIIDETVPEELRDTFQYFNSQDINILNMNVEKPVFDDDEPEQSIDLDDEMSDDKDESFSEPIDFKEDSNVDLNIF